MRQVNLEHFSSKSPRSYMNHTQPKMLGLLHTSNAVYIALIFGRTGCLIFRDIKANHVCLCLCFKAYSFGVRRLSRVCLAGIYVIFAMSLSSPFHRRSSIIPPLLAGCYIEFWPQQQQQQHQRQHQHQHLGCPSVQMLSKLVQK